MKRHQRAAIAKETVAICEAGFYHGPGGTRVAIAEELARARAGTVLYSPESPPKPATAHRKPTILTVKNETTFQALSRLAALGGGHVACLNFASAKNPGGGFLNGSQAQEEALALASGLYPCLLEARAYYENNRAHRSALYLDLAIFSPQVPFFRNDAGTLLEKPILASVITAPAPNAGAIAENEPANLALVEPTLKRRARLVLEIACAHGVERLVLGAWGCGVFRNDPKVVARIFSEFLRPPGLFAGGFDEVCFAVLDRTDEQSCYRTFASIIK
jgi:uncharacterized protein (TIGR02452 family)